MRQLQTLLQPQAASQESFTDTVNETNQVLPKELEVAKGKINSVQQDFGRRLKRGESTSPPRKAARRNKMDRDIEPPSECAIGQPPALASSIRPPTTPRCTTLSCALAPRRATDSEDRFVIFKLPELSTSRASRAGRPGVGGRQV